MYIYIYTLLKYAKICLLVSLILQFIISKYTTVGLKSEKYAKTGLKILFISSHFVATRKHTPSYPPLNKHNY